MGGINSVSENLSHDRNRMYHIKSNDENKKVYILKNNYGSFNINVNFNLYSLKISGIDDKYTLRVKLYEDFKNKLNLILKLFKNVNIPNLELKKYIIFRGNEIKRMVKLIKISDSLNIHALLKLTNNLGDIKMTLCATKIECYQKNILL